jgi:hypothetical protein
MKDERLRNLMVFEDLEEPEAWRVEWFDSDGSGYIAKFEGHSAEQRARDYHDAIAKGQLDARIDHTQQDAKLLRFPRK